MANNDDEKLTEQYADVEIDLEILLKCLWLLLRKVGGMVSFDEEAIRKAPDKDTLDWSFDGKSWTLIAKGKRRRGIIKPSERMIRP